MGRVNLKEKLNYYNNIDYEFLGGLLSFGNDIKSKYDESTKVYKFSGNYGRRFKRVVEELIGSKKLLKVFRSISGGEITIDSFFLLELKHIIIDILGNRRTSSVNKKTLTNLLEHIEENTWLSNLDKDNYPSVLDMSRIDKYMSIKPEEFQKVVYSRYSDLKNKLGFKGMLVDASTGTGKTPMSIMWSVAMKPEVTIIVSMGANINTTWVSSLVDKNSSYFKTPISLNDVFLKDDLYNGVKYNNESYIVITYEALSKMDRLVNQLKNKKSVIIVDEAHNFTSLNNSRKHNLVKLIQDIKCEDCMLLSGTPIKTSSLELITYLEIIDPRYTDTVSDRYRNIYGSPNAFLKTISPIRFGDISVRIEKKELNLEPVEYLNMDISLPNGNKYTLESIKKDMIVYKEKREKELKQLLPEYIKTFNRIISTLRQRKVSNEMSWTRYLQCHEIVSKAGMLWDVKEELEIVRNFEKNIILANLDRVDKELFREASTVIKYPMLKIRGEILGGVVLRARIECHRDMAKVFDYQVLNDSVGKSIIMSGYVEVCDTIKSAVEKEGFKPTMIYGDYIKNQDKSITEFKTNKDIDPLIGTFKSISTGHHLVVADTIVIMDLPFRTYLLDQAIARSWRKGQENIVKVIYPKLITGNEPNINSRNVDILKWAKDAVEEVTGNKVTGLDFDQSTTINILDLESLNENYVLDEEELDLEFYINIRKDLEMDLKGKLSSYSMDLESIEEGVEKTGTYVSVKVLNHKELYDFFKAQGVDVVDSTELHNTISYSRETFERAPNEDTITISVDEMKPKLERLGDEGAVVLKHSNPEVIKRFNECMEAGATYDYPEYQPHITITYNGKDLNLDEIKIPDFDIILGEEEVVPLDKDWTDKLTTGVDTEGFLDWFKGKGKPAMETNLGVLNLLAHKDDFIDANFDEMMEGFNGIKPDVLEDYIKALETIMSKTKGKGYHIYTDGNIYDGNGDKVESETLTEKYIRETKILEVASVLLDGKLYNWNKHMVSEMKKAIEASEKKVSVGEHFFGEKLKYTLIAIKDEEDNANKAILNKLKATLEKVIKHINSSLSKDAGFGTDMKGNNKMDLELYKTSNNIKVYELGDESRSKTKTLEISELKSKIKGKKIIKLSSSVLNKLKTELNNGTVTDKYSKAIDEYKKGLSAKDAATVDSYVEYGLIRNTNNILFDTAALWYTDSEDVRKQLITILTDTINSVFKSSGLKPIEFIAKDTNNADSYYMLMSKDGVYDIIFDETHDNDSFSIYAPKWDVLESLFDLVSVDMESINGLSLFQLSESIDMESINTYEGKTYLTRVKSGVNSNNLVSLVSELITDWSDTILKDGVKTSNSLKEATDKLTSISNEFEDNLIGDEYIRVPEDNIPEMFKSDEAYAMKMETMDALRTECIKKINSNWDIYVGTTDSNEFIAGSNEMNLFNKTLFDTAFKVLRVYKDNTLAEPSVDLESHDVVVNSVEMDELELNAVADVDSVKEANLERPVLKDEYIINTLSDVVDVVDMEAFDYIKGLVANGIDKASGIMNKLKGLFRTSPVSDTEYSKLLNKVVNSGDTGNTLLDKRVGVPAGMVGKLVDISEYVKTDANSIDLLNANVLKAIDIVSSFINSEDLRESFQMDKSFTKNLDNIGKVLHNKNSKILTNSRVDVVRVGSLIDSTSDLTKVINNLKIASKHITISKLEEVRNNLTLVDDFIKVLVEDKSKFSKVKIQEIGYMIDSLNSCVNGVATLVFLKNNLDIIVNDITNLK